jgi:inhibitor of cysteine peptidase
MTDALQLGAGDNGGSPSLVKGQRLVLQLPENATTGYRWAVVSSGALELISNTYEIGAGGAGAGGMRRLEWLAVALGTSELLLLHRREWEGAGQEIGRFKITVAVR